MELNKNWLIPSGIGIGSLCVGFGLGYFWAKRNTGESFYEFVEGEERESEPGNEQLAIDFNEKMDQVFGELQELRERVGVDNQLVEEEIEDDEPEPEAIEVNVFTEVDTEWNWEEETQARNSDFPYVIHKDEFFDEESGHRQSSLTWYEGDEILVDDKDVPIYNWQKITGELKFGHGSKDANVVYIRNEELDAEYEILRHTGYYQIEVLGAEIEEQYEHDDDELAHSVRKFRSD